MRSGIGLVLCLGVVVSTARGNDPGIEFFEKKIRPVLVQHCYRCHSSAKRQRGGLALDSAAALRKGGDSGPAIVPGKPGESLLIKAVRYNDPDLQMPPKGKLPAAVIADFEKWIAMGAPDPRTGKQVVQSSGISIEEGRKFWAFQPPQAPPIPHVRNAGWCRSPIDRFILARLEARGLAPVENASRAVLLRRVYFDLIGLPPSPEEIDRFVNDNRPDAFERVVDTLLANPHFGERWARHWLDVARFAESTGGGRSMLLTEAWRYRDYVIRAFNEDLPYDQFIREQIAGDLLPSGSTEERYWRLIATAFLLLGPNNYELQDKPVLETDVIDEQLDTIGRSILGMTIGCARCHDHKFDPIPQRDYYALAGILKSTKSLVHANVSKWMERPLPLPEAREKQARQIEAKVAALAERVKSLRRQLERSGVLAARGPLAVKDLPGIVVDDSQAKIVGQWRTSTFKNTFIGKGYRYAGPSANQVHTLTFTPEIPHEGKYEVRLAYLAHPNRAVNTKVYILHADGEEDLRINQRKIAPIDGRWISLGTYRFTNNGQWFVMVSTEGVKGGVVVADAVQFLDEEARSAAAAKPHVKDAAGKRAELARLESELKRLKARLPKRPMAMAVAEAEKIGDFYVCIRGNVHNKGPTVPRGFLQVATIGEMPAIGANESGRRQLADWLASRNNPLTARVMVNRIWQHLFGIGIVATPDNFGKTGSPPSHPHLLDYLAVRFMNEGWSVKKLIRAIVLSRTYQLSALADPNDRRAREAMKIDPENRLLWRQNRRRLEAEAIRDAILTVSGTLDVRMGGPNFHGKKIVERTYDFPDTRRSVYTPVLRNNVHEMLAVFDFPDPNLVTGRRAVSTVAPQALYLMNNPFVLEQARAAARRILERQELGDDAARVDYAYRLALGRLPTARERELALRFLREAAPDRTSPQLQSAWRQFYQVLFSCIDFRYIN